MLCQSEKSCCQLMFYGEVRLLHLSPLELPADLCNFGWTYVVTDGGDGCGVVIDGGDSCGVVKNGGDGCGVVIDRWW